MKTNKIKLITLVGTRPEIIRLSRIITELDKFFDHTFIHTGQNFDFELNELFFKDLDLRLPDIYLECGGGNAANTIAQVIKKSDEVYSDLNPDALLILGDTNSSLAAIPAKRRKIPIFHMEAGNRSYDQRVPEEINRKIVDHISDINLPYTQIARDYLIAEGINPETIIKTGSPLDEVIHYYRDKIDSSSILEEMKIEPKKYLLVSSHREENIDYDNFFTFVELLNGLAKKFNFPILLSTHPRTKKRIEKENIKFNKLVRLHKPFSFTDYCKLQIESRAVLSDSGSITEESSILNFPALNLRETHERPEGFEEGSVILTGLKLDNVLLGIEILDEYENDLRQLNKVKDYNSLNLSLKIPRIILSYIDYVNNYTWKKK
jgi:UDP-N-acetylglucosamine 2-epimerase (non-hydrolysing)